MEEDKSVNILFHAYLLINMINSRAKQTVLQIILGSANAAMWET